MTRRHRSAVSKAMKKRAEVLRCPQCDRGAALKRVKDHHGFTVAVVCRWPDCRYEKPVETPPPPDEGLLRARRKCDCEGGSVRWGET